MISEFFSVLGFQLLWSRSCGWMWWWSCSCFWHVQ